MEAFPAFFPLTGARVIIAGEGEMAEAKARLLAGSPATVVRLAGEAALKPESYAGAALVFVASPDEAFLQAAAAAAKTAGAPVNVVDHPALSDFHTPAIIDRGQVVAAIGTAGAAPMLAALLRSELEARIPEGLGAVAGLLGRFRAELRAAFPDLPARRAFLRSVLDGPIPDLAMTDPEAAGERFKADIARGVAVAGKVWLIAAPSERDLLTLRAARALGMADVLVVSDGVGGDLTALARRDAAWRTLAGTDAAFLADLAAKGLQAVVLAPGPHLRPVSEQLFTLSAAHELLLPAAEA